MPQRWVTLERGWRGTFLDLGRKTDQKLGIPSQHPLAERHVGSKPIYITVGALGKLFSAKCLRNWVSFEIFLHSTVNLGCRNTQIMEWLLCVLSQRNRSISPFLCFSQEKLCPNPFPWSSQRMLCLIPPRLMLLFWVSSWARGWAGIRAGKVEWRLPELAWEGRTDPYEGMVWRLEVKKEEEGP